MHRIAVQSLANPLVLGYHGCTKAVAHAVLTGELEHLKASTNKWDWLGSGIYFWEADPRRGLEWAEARYGRNEAAVVGAVIHLGNCLNLMSRDAIAILGIAHTSFVENYHRVRPGEALPENANTRYGPSHALDCAVLNHLHKAREKHTIDGRPAPLPPFDTVRGLYQEGSAAFSGSRIMAKTHIQLCIRTPERSIKGYFRVPEPHLAAA